MLERKAMANKLVSDPTGLKSYFQFGVEGHQMVFYHLQELDGGGSKLTARTARPATPQEIELWDHLLRLNTT
jgi:hypothetical protein